MTKNPLQLFTLNERGNTPLHSAIAKGYGLDTIKLLLHPKVIRYKNRRGNTPLHIALLLRRGLSIVKLVFLQELDVGNRGGRTPMHLVQDNESCWFLIKKNFRINVVDKKGNTPLHYAARRPSSHPYLKFLATRENVDTRNKDGLYPLNVACIRAISYLSKVSCDDAKNVVDGQGLTVLEKVCLISKAKLAKYLITDSNLK